jgi:hypothetical protein
MAQANEGSMGRWVSNIKSAMVLVIPILEISDLRLKLSRRSDLKA